MRLLLLSLLSLRTCFVLWRKVRPRAFRRNDVDSVFCLERQNFLHSYVCLETRAFLFASFFLRKFDTFKHESGVGGLCSLGHSTIVPSPWILFFCDCVKQFVNSCVKELCGDDVCCRALRSWCFLYEPIHACLNVWSQMKSTTAPVMFGPAEAVNEK